LTLGSHTATATHSPVLFLSSLFRQVLGYDRRVLSQPNCLYCFLFYGYYCFCFCLHSNLYRNAYPPPPHPDLRDALARSFPGVGGSTPSRRPLPVSPRPPSGIDTSRCWARQCRRTGETPVFCTSVCVCVPLDAAVIPVTWSTSTRSPRDVRRSSTWLEIDSMLTTISMATSATGLDAAVIPVTYAPSPRHLRSLSREGGGSSCGRLWRCSCGVLCGGVLVVCVCVCECELTRSIPVLPVSSGPWLRRAGPLATKVPGAS